MKGFLIFMAVVIGGSIYAFTHSLELAQGELAKVRVAEGAVDQAYYELMSRDPAAFGAKYRPFLEKRQTIQKWSARVGDTQFVMDLGKETRERYDETPLATDPAYEELLFLTAATLEDQSQGQDAYTALRRYQELFPTGKHSVESASAIQRILVKYNVK